MSNDLALAQAALIGEVCDNLTLACQSLHSLSPRSPSNATGAHHDYEAVALWLSQYEPHEPDPSAGPQATEPVMPASWHTYIAYEKEAVRLLAWCRTQGKAFRQLDFADTVAFSRFLVNPSPRELWCSEKIRHKNSPEWRPFKKPLTPKSQRQALIILNNLFNWLIMGGYCLVNPFALDRQRRRKRRTTVKQERYLHGDQFAAVWAHLDTAAPESEKQQTLLIRRRWTFALLYFGALRISEALYNKMAAFRYNSDLAVDGATGWMLKIAGKGNVLRDVPVSARLLEELHHYRASIGWQPLPLDQEDRVRPLLPASKVTIHNDLKALFRATAETLDGASAHRLESASAHWLRHTRATHLLNRGGQPHQVKEILGHESLDTLSIYVHGDTKEKAALVNRVDDKL